MHVSEFCQRRERARESDGEDEPCFRDEETFTSNFSAK